MTVKNTSKVFVLITMDLPVFNATLAYDDEECPIFE